MTLKEGRKHLQRLLRLVLGHCVARAHDCGICQFAPAICASTTPSLGTRRHSIALDIASYLPVQQRRRVVRQEKKERKKEPNEAENVGKVMGKESVRKEGGRVGEGMSKRRGQAALGT